MSGFLGKKTESLSGQALILIAGRFLVLPVSFLVPIVLVRSLSISEFGHYKQLFMVFQLCLPLMDFGITQGLIYFVPKYPKKKLEIVSQFINWQFLVSLLFFSLFVLFRNEISYLFTGSEEISRFLPYIGCLIVVWAISNNLEILLTATKQPTYASFIVFFSESLKCLSIIILAFLTGELLYVVIGFLAVGGLRLLWFLVYLVKDRCFSVFYFDQKLFVELAKYGAPLGIAVLVNSMIEYTHQVIVSNQLSAAEFAIYSIACLQIPFVGIVSISVAHVAIVRISELHQENDLGNIVRILSNSFRKLSLIFFPAFIFLWAVAPYLITLLYTDAYAQSIPIFRTFIWILPLAAILVEYTPRSLGDSKVVLKVNVITLLINVVLVVALLYAFGTVGAAAAFVISMALRKIFIINYLRKKLRAHVNELVPFRALSKILICSLLAVIPGVLLTGIIETDTAAALSLATGCYAFFGAGLFWFGGVLNQNEKDACSNAVKAAVSKLKSFLS